MKILTDEQIEKKVKKKKILKTIIKIIIYPIIIFLCAISIYTFAQRMINPDKVIDIFGYKAFSITSGSMEDTLNVGDLIIVKNIKDENSIKEDDIISFQMKNSIITHRVVKVEEERDKKYFITKGDNNTTNDEDKVIFENIEGKFVKKFSKIGKYLFMLQDTNIVIIIALVLYLIYSIYSEREDRKIARHQKRKKNEQ